VHILQKSQRCPIGAEVHARVAQVVFDGIVVIQRCGTVGRTPPFGKINSFEVGTAVLDVADVVFGSSPGNFGKFLAICSVGHGSGTAGQGKGLGQVEEIIGQGHVLMLVLRHVPDGIVEIMVAREACCALEAFGAIAVGIAERSIMPVLPSVKGVHL